MQFIRGLFMGDIFRTHDTMAFETAWRHLHNNNLCYIRKVETKMDRNSTCHKSDGRP